MSEWNRNSAYPDANEIVQGRDRRCLLSPRSFSSCTNTKDRNPRGIGGRLPVFGSWSGLQTGVPAPSQGHPHRRAFNLGLGVHRCPLAAPRGPSSLSQGAPPSLSVTFRPPCSTFSCHSVPAAWTVLPFLMFTRGVSLSNTLTYLMFYAGRLPSCLSGPHPACPPTLPISGASV